MIATPHGYSVMGVRSWGRDCGTAMRWAIRYMGVLGWASSVYAAEDGAAADITRSFPMLTASIGFISLWILATGGVLLLAMMLYRRRHLPSRTASPSGGQHVQSENHKGPVESLLQRQMEFNNLITAFLTKVTTSESDKLPTLICDYIQRITLFMGGEAAMVITLARDATAWSCAYVWGDTGTPDLFARYQNVPLGTLAWPENRILSGDMILLSSLRDLPPETSDYHQHLEELGVKSLIMLPFHGQDGVITGCVTFMSFIHETIWSQEEVQQLKLSSDVLASVLDQKWAEERNRKESTRIQWLLRLHDQSDTMTDNEILESALEAAVNFTDSEGGFLHSINTDQNTLAATLWSQETLKQCNLSLATHYPFDKAGMWAEAVRQKQPVIYNNIQTKTGEKTYPEGHAPIIHLVTLPVLDGDLVSRVIGVCNKPTPYDNYDVRQLQIIGNEIQKMMARRRGEEALRNSREQYALAVDGVNDGVWDWNLQTNAFSLSSRWKSMLGYDNPDLADRYETWEALIHPDDKARVIAMLQIYLAKPVDIFESEMRLRCKDGNYRWILVRGKALRDETGTPYRMAGSHTDITERKQNEEEVRTERDYAQRILDTIETVIVSINRKGQITLINRKGCELLGYQEEELIGANWFERCLPQPKGREHDYPAFREIMSGIHEGPSYDESEVLLHNGERRLIAWRNTYLYNDKNHRVGTLQGGEDITERKLAEEALRASELKYRIVAENTYDWEFWCAPDNTYLYVSPSCERISGYTADAFMADPDLMERIIYPGDKQLWANHHLETSPSSELTHIELRIVCADNAMRWIAHEYRAVFDGMGKYLGLRGSNRDITAIRATQERERFQREQALRANKLISLGTLVSGVAHEINNPNHIISFSASTIGRIWMDVQMFLEESHIEDDYRFGGLDWKRVRENVPELLTSLRNASDRIKDIVEDLRAYARPDLERIVEEVDMGIVVHAAATWLSNLIKKSTHRFSFICEPGVPCVHGNRRRLEQVLVNLVLNACQSLPDPDRAIRVLLTQDAAAGQVIVEVVDEGVGMSKEILDQIMDPFFTTKRDIGSAGLGLSIVFGIVNEHGGTLTFESTVGIGTTARVILPVSKEET